MPANREKLLLQRLLLEMEDSAILERERRLRVENIVNRVFAAVIVLAVVGTGLVDLVWHDILLISAAFAVGLSVGWDAVRNAHFRDLALIERYFDRDRIERRLRELSASSGD